MQAAGWREAVGRPRPLSAQPWPNPSWAESITGALRSALLNEGRSTSVAERRWPGCLHRLRSRLPRPHRPGQRRVPGCWPARPGSLRYGLPSFLVPPSGVSGCGPRFHVHDPSVRALGVQECGPAHIPKSRGFPMLKTQCEPAMQARSGGFPHGAPKDHSQHTLSRPGALGGANRRLGRHLA